ncbi:MAG: tetratricopeptide repeat protein [Bacteroidota bacterium]|nr:tetratricopeptide repeat protein [Bacteroidota bacterium]
MSFKLWVYLFFAICIKSYSQLDTDSLKKKLLLAKTDSVKLRLYALLSENSEGNDVFEYSKPGIEIAEKLIKEYKLDKLDIRKSDLLENVSKKIKINTLNYYGKVLFAQGSEEINMGNNLKGLSYLNKALEMQSIIGDTLQIAATLENIGAGLYCMGSFANAIKTYSRSLQLNAIIKNKNTVATCYIGIGNSLKSQGNIAEAIDFTFKALKAAEELKDFQDVAIINTNLSAIYSSIGDYQKALDYGLVGLKLAEKYNFKTIISASYINISFVYKKTNNTKKMMEYLNKSIKSCEELGNKNQLVIAYKNLGTTYKDEKNYKKALEYFIKSNNIATEINSVGEIANTNCKIGELYFTQNNIPLALDYAIKGYNISKKLNTPNEIKNATSLLKDIFEKKGEYKKALEMNKLYYSLRDSLSNDDIKRESTRKQFQFEYEKKALADSLKNSEQKKIILTKISLQNAELKQQKTIRLALIAGIAGVLLFFIILYSRFVLISRQKATIHQQTEALQTQKNELELKNKSITESIESAKHIQFSIFVSKVELELAFKNYFTLIKPFANLSGDFLWLKTLNTKTFLALGDCTGHGVPASLLTMLANEFLNKIIIQKQIFNPSKILQELNSEFYNFTIRKQQTGNKLNEGMDVAICVIDKSTKKLYYAGTRIDLYTVNNNGELLISKSYKIELGKQSDIVMPTEASFDLDEIKNFYITSDGLRDQLKYRSNKTRFGFTGFEDFIKNNHNLNFETQKENILKLYSDLTTNEKQIDDITVFGFKP